MRAKLKKLAVEVLTVVAFVGTIGWVGVATNAPLPESPVTAETERIRKATRDSEKKTLKQECSYGKTFCDAYEKYKKKKEKRP
jgi:hypothetical protein